jgi:hypothetical protein
MRIRLLIAVLGCLSLSLAGFAQDEAPESPDAPEAPEAPADENPQASKDRDIEESEDDGAEDSTDVDEFIFSEEIPADTQLVFPVDI